MDLLTWARAFALPRTSDGAPRRSRFTAESLAAPAELRTDAVAGTVGTRRPNGDAIAIDSAGITADREGFRAVGLAMLAYALSPQGAPMRIHLAASSGIRQVVLGPVRDSRLEAALGFRAGVREIHYRPRIPEGNPNYTTTEQDDASYPREHLPHCAFGTPEMPGAHVGTAADCVHFTGTGPSLVWMGKFLLNLGLEDIHCRLAYLYNTVPAESLAPGSAELRLEVDERRSEADD
jgi:hypothetical protein